MGQMIHSGLFWSPPRALMFPPRALLWPRAGPVLIKAKNLESVLPRWSHWMRWLKGSILARHKCQRQTWGLVLSSSTQAKLSILSFIMIPVIDYIHGFTIGGCLICLWIQSIQIYTFKKIYISTFSNYYIDMGKTLSTLFSIENICLYWHQWLTDES